MLFQTKQFLLAFSGFWLLLSWVGSWRPEYRKALILGGSYLFYLTSGFGNLLILLASSLMNFGISVAMARSSRPHAGRLLALLVSINLSALIFLKYGGGFSKWLAPPGVNIIFPLGFSFYTFHSISYAVDIYRGTAVIRSSWVDYASYVAFFPQLISGPLARAGEFFPEFDRDQGTNRMLWEGVVVFLIGLLKKVLVADGFLLPMTQGKFEGLASQSLLEIVLACLAFNFQVYYDFSGYCDMATGLGLLLGIRLPANFNKPFLAASIREHWQRWHITLSRWVRDYVYIPLGGSQKGKARQMVNIGLAMWAVAFWHGTSWGVFRWWIFIFVALVLSHLTKRRFTWLRSRVPFFVQCCLVMLTLALGRLLYKVNDGSELSALFGRSWLSPFEWKVSSGGILHLALLGFVPVQYWIARRNLRQKLIDTYSNAHPALRVLVAAILLIMLVGPEASSRSFIYHHF